MRANEVALEAEGRTSGRYFYRSYRGGTVIVETGNMCLLADAGAAPPPLVENEVYFVVGRVSGSAPIEEVSEAGFVTRREVPVIRVLFAVNGTGEVLHSAVNP